MRPKCKINTYTSTNFYCGAVVKKKKMYRLWIEQKLFRLSNKFGALCIVLRSDLMNIAKRLSGVIVWIWTRRIEPSIRIDGSNLKFGRNGLNPDQMIFIRITDWSIRCSSLVNNTYSYRPRLVCASDGYNQNLPMFLIPKFVLFSEC